MRTIVFVGNPNTGKTTLFNTLTKSSEHASNWHGVTVSEKNKEININGQSVCAVDLPGLNSLCAISPEEKISVDAIKNYAYKNDTIFALVCDAGNLNKNLFLAFEFKEVGLPFFIILNMANEIKGDKETLVKTLEKEFLTKCFLVDGRKRKQVKALACEICKISKDVSFDKKSFNFNSNFNFEKMAENRFKNVEKLLENTHIYVPKTEKLNKLLFNPYISIPLFLTIFLGIFWIVFGPAGSFLSGLLEKYLVGGLLESIVAKGYATKPLLGAFLEAVLITGVGSVICFLPQIILLFMLLSLLEDIGLLARFAYTLDAPFRRVGLSGRSVFSILSGFGCTTSSVLITRNLENNRLRVRTALSLPFFGCSAKVPVLLVVASLFFKKYKFLCVFGVYIFSILLCFFILFLTTLGERKHRQPFLMEMPRLRLPSLKKIAIDTKANFFSFFSRTLGTVLLLCVVMFFMQSFDFTFKLVETSGKKSMLETLANFLAPIFSPLGFGFYGVVVALLFGLVAKEMLVSSLALINGVALSGLAASLVSSSSPIFFTAASSLSFLVFCMLFTPCIPSLNMIKAELGRKYAVFCAFFQFFLAYLCSFFTYQLAKGNMIALWILVALLVAIFIYIMLKWRSKRGEHRCYGCTNKFGTCGRKN